MAEEKSFSVNNDCLTIHEGVTELNNTLFDDYTIPYKEIKKVVLPKSLQTLNYDFRGYKSLREVNFSGNTQLKEIPNKCFQSLKNLKKITLPESIELVGSEAFARSGLKSLELKANQLRIGDGAFATSELKSVKLETLRGPITLGEFCFSFSQSLDSVEIKTPKGVGLSLLGRHCFFYCIKMKKLILDCDTEVIPKSFLESCDRLKELQLPKSVKFIDFTAFKGCYSLRLIELPDTVEKIADNNVFSDVFPLAMIKFLDSYWECNTFISLVDGHNENNVKMLDFKMSSEAYTEHQKSIKTVLSSQLMTLRDFIIDKFPEEFAVKRGSNNEEAPEEVSLF